MTRSLDDRGLRTADYSFDLPPDLVAQQPLAQRDASRLLVVDRRSGSIEHRTFADLPELLRPGDLLVANRSRVIPARLPGSRCDDGRAVELLLLKDLGGDRWECLGKPARRLRVGTAARFGAVPGVEGTIDEVLPDGRRVVQFASHTAFAALLERIGTTPLPPYIKASLGDPERYQTVYGDRPGSVAAPTAGLHFTAELLRRIADRGIGIGFVTLHVGADTFRPLRSDLIVDHSMHSEWVDVSDETLRSIRSVRQRGGRVVVIGTTTVRALESAAVEANDVGHGWSGWTSLYITPGHRFAMVDALLTNFHLPRSSLLVLVSAFAGRALVLSAYDEAIRRRYRFYSFGDATLFV